MPGETEDKQEPRMVGNYELKDNEIYRHGVDEPTGKNAAQFEWRSVPNLNPYGNADEPSGWIGKEISDTNKDSSQVDEGEGFGKTKAWRHTDNEPVLDDRKEDERRKILGIPDPMGDD